MHLPNEVLGEILSFVIHHRNISVTCKKFYEISCNLKTFILKIETTPDYYSLKPFTKCLENRKLFKSIMTSNKKVSKLHIYSHGSIFPISNKQKLTKIIKHFGKNVTDLKIRYTILSFEDFNLFNLMPNLERLQLNNVKCENFEVPLNFQLNLYELKEIEIEDCSEKVMEVISRLSDDVLRKLDLKSNDNQVFKDHFGQFKFGNSF